MPGFNVSVVPGAPNGLATEVFMNIDALRRLMGPKLGKRPKETPPRFIVIVPEIVNKALIEPQTPVTVAWGLPVKVGETPGTVVDGAFGFVKQFWKPLMRPEASSMEPTELLTTVWGPVTSAEIKSDPVTLAVIKLLMPVQK